MEEKQQQQLQRKKKITTQRLSSPKTRSTSLLLPGTRVRLNKSKGTFEKGYLPNWTTELFTVDRLVTGRTPPVYRIKDDHGEVLQGTFYPEEIQPILKTDDVYAVDRVLKRRPGQKQGQEEVLVKWTGFPASFISWIPADHLQIKEHAVSQTHSEGGHTR
ncbi:uncharacterized protein LOC125383684 [Haliotis rufescens]|uniref:uncharacterized protein LOC125383684 n=1 Tax=Haliotis rufescens TaxID=6454 RepID=UPI00201F34C6|nr:uncharacterized protein LOC125383684 [Haliotis rufescens]